MLRFALIASFSLFFQFAVSQSNTSIKTYYTAFDSIVGYNHTPLYNGLRYIDAYRTTKENHSYFEFYDFLKGDIIYDGQPFYGLNLKYDLYHDVLVAKLTGDRSFFNLQLNTHKLSACTIDGHSFIVVPDNESLTNLGIQGLIEQKYKGDVLAFFIKHTKSMRERIKGNQVEHLFKKKETYLLQFNNVFYKVDSKNDFTKLFPDQSKEIKAFYSNYRILANSNPVTFMEQLVAHLNNRLSNNPQ